MFKNNLFKLFTAVFVGLVFFLILFPRTVYCQTYPSVKTNFVTIDATVRDSVVHVIAIKIKSKDIKAVVVSIGMDGKSLPILQSSLAPSIEGTTTWHYSKKEQEIIIYPSKEGVKSNVHVIIALSSALTQDQLECRGFISSTSDYSQLMNTTISIHTGYPGK